MILGQDHTVV